MIDLDALRNALDALSRASAQIIEKDGTIITLRKEIERLRCELYSRRQNAETDMMPAIS